MNTTGSRLYPHREATSVIQLVSTWPLFVAEKWPQHWDLHALFFAKCLGSLTQRYEHWRVVRRSLQFIVLQEDKRVSPFTGVITKAALSTQFFKDPACWPGRDAWTNHLPHSSPTQSHFIMMAWFHISSNPVTQ